MNRSSKTKSERQDDVAENNNWGGRSNAASQTTRKHKDESEPEIRQQILDEFKDDIRDACQEKLVQQKAQLESEIRREVEEEARPEIDQAVRERLRERRNTLRPEVHDQVMREKGTEDVALVEQRLQEMLNEEEPEIRQKIHEETSDEINEGVRERLAAALEEAKPELHQQVMAQFQEQIKARIEQLKEQQSIDQSYFADTPGDISIGERSEALRRLFVQRLGWAVHDQKFPDSFQKTYGTDCWLENAIGETVVRAYALGILHSKYGIEAEKVWIPAEVGGFKDAQGKPDAHRACDTQIELLHQHLRQALPMWNETTIIDSIRQFLLSHLDEKHSNAA